MIKYKVYFFNRNQKNNYKHIKIFFLSVFTSFLLLASCNNSSNSLQKTVLPIYGTKDYINGDTVYHTIGEFEFINQYNKKFTKNNVKGKVYVADFFFTSCPNQCPKMSSQMKRLATNTKDIDDLLFVSHAIDFKNDTIEKIKKYIKNNGLDFKNWFFLEAREGYTSNLASLDYQVLTKEDIASDGGFAHSPFFILIDKIGRIRGYYDGQITEEVNQLEKDIRKLFEIEYGVQSK